MQFIARKLSIINTQVLKTGSEPHPHINNFFKNFISNLFLYNVQVCHLY